MCMVHESCDQRRNHFHSRVWNDLQLSLFCPTLWAVFSSGSKPKWMKLPREFINYRSVKLVLTDTLEVISFKVLARVTSYAGSV
jgi:hypothetical protein